MKKIIKCGDNSEFSVSVIIPCLPMRLSIIDAIASVINQSLSPKEIIVILDCARLDDDKVLYEKCSEKISNYIYNLNCKKINIKIFSSIVNVGASGCRNLGVEYSSSEYVAFLDDDDTWMPAKLFSQVGVINSTNADLVTCSSKKKYGNNKNKGIFEKVSILDTIFSRKIFGGHKYGLHTSSLVIRRNLMLENKFDENLIRHEDWDLLIRLSKIANCYCIYDYLLIHNTNGLLSRLDGSKFSMEFFTKHENTMNDKCKKQFVYNILSKKLGAEFKFDILNNLTSKYHLNFIEISKCYIYFFVQYLRMNIRKLGNETE